MHRRLAALSLLIAILIATLIFVQVAPVTPGIVRIAENGASGVFRLDDTAVLFDTECTDSTWQVENIESITFGGRPVTGEGTAEVCQRHAELRVNFRDGQSKRYRITKQPLVDHLIVRAGLVTAVCLLIASVIWSGIPHKLIRFLRQTAFHRVIGQWLPVMPPEENGPAVKILSLLVVSGLTLIAMALRTYFLSKPISYDEAWTYLSFASQPFSVALSNYSSTNNHLFHTLLVHFTTATFGIHDWSVRLPAYWAGILLIPTTYQVGKQFYGHFAGFIAAGFMVGASYVVEWSTSARGYPIVVLCFLLLLLVGKRLIERPSRSVWVAYALVAAMGLFTIPTMAYPLAVASTWLGLSLFFRYRGVERLRLLRDFAVVHVLSALLTGVLYAPALAFYLQHRNENLDVNHLMPTTWEFFLRHFGTELKTAWAFWHRDFASSTAICMIVAAVVSVVFHNNVAKYRVSLVSSLVIALIPIIFIQYVTTFARLWTFALPVYFVFVGAGVTYLWQFITHKKLRSATRQIATFAAFAIAIGAGIATLSTDSIVMSFEGSRSIGAEDLIQTIRARNDDLVVYCIEKCKSHEFYAAIYDVPFTPLPIEERYKPYYVIIGFHVEIQDLQSGFQSIDYDMGLIQNAELVFETIDSALYRVTPAQPSLQ